MSKEQPPKREAFETQRDYNLAYLGYLCLICPELKGTYIHQCVIKSLAKEEDADKNDKTK